MKSFISLLLSLVSSFSLWGQYSLTVFDQQSSSSASGNIDVAEISMKPEGVYTAVDLDLTFSVPEGLPESRNYQLSWQFTLPYEVQVTGVWIEVNDEYIKADVVGKNELIWGPIEKDSTKFKHLILYEFINESFRLDLYPISLTQPRKVKFSYLMPSNWHEDRVYTALPMGLLQSSARPLESVVLNVFQGEEWGIPKVDGASPAELIPEGETSLLKHWKIVLEANVLRQQIAKMETGVPTASGVFFDTMGDSMYQLVVVPGPAFSLPERQESRNLMVVLEYNSSKLEGVSQSYLLEMLKDKMKTYAQGQDSFNLILANANIEPLYSTWLPADPSTLNTVFDNLPENPIGDEHDISALLSAGLEFVQRQGNGEILLVAANNNYVDIGAADRVVQRVIDEMGEQIIPIHSLDYQNDKRMGAWYNGTFYTGNTYFYKSLADLTGGTNSERYACSITRTLECNTTNIMTAIWGTRAILTADLDPTSGRTFADQNLHFASMSRGFDGAMYQIGRYEGEGPFRLTLDFQNADTLLTTQLLRNDLSWLGNSKTLFQAWAGVITNKLENAGPHQWPGYSTRQDIVRLSKEAEILTQFSMMIALEKENSSDTYALCTDTSIWRYEQKDEEEVVTEEGVIKAYPMPFRDQVNIYLKLPANTALAEFKFMIFNSLGQKITELTNPQLSQEDELTLTWGGEDASGKSTPAGQYYLLITGPGFNRVQNLNRVN
ncbi:MAG: hypothetical protein F6K19_06630 [Cyanothece sp. SIO1E1]|nr:hypothetical protein [Cyanothece sp. SIO1E1]